MSLQGTAGLAGPSRSEAEPTLAERLAALGLDERRWRVLELRVGIGAHATLNQVGAVMGVTRARVQQIQKGACMRARSRHRWLDPSLSSIEQNIGALSPDSAFAASAQSLSRRLAGALSKMSQEHPRLLETYRLAILVRAMCDVGDSAAERSWPKTSFLCCAAHPPILRHSQVAAERARHASREREERREWSYKELAQQVLREYGNPLHWTAIAERAERLGHRGSFSTSGLFSTLQARGDLFVRTAAGTYSLAQPGLANARPYSDLIAEALLAAGRPLAGGEVSVYVNARRAIKPVSLALFLDDNPRFYRAVDGTYGLRAWLPLREMQTLLTPDRLVEDQKSLARVGRAQARGWDVPGIIDRDRASGAAATPEPGSPAAGDPTLADHTC